MSARDNILNRLRIGARTAFAHPNATTAREAEWAAKQPPIGDPARRFLAEIGKVGTSYLRVPDWTAVPDAVTSWVREYGISSVMTGTTPALEPLREHLRAQGVDTRILAETAETQREEIFNTDCGITTARGAIADTGSLLLIPSAQEPRLLSLAMPVHIALLERANLFPTLADYLANNEFRNQPPTNLVLVSGASRTADIELTLTVGVHGPKVLLVALIG
ncbi:MAG: lactate utilization protein [Candidatus Lambdaproteobacteria bacterium]|nr:lactate utilization protein [Candidatus Lambdaproteobacteria bacterium]